MARRNRMPGEETEFHQPPSVVFWQVQTIQNAGLPVLQLHEVCGLRIVKRVMFRVPRLLDSRLHLEPSIYLEIL